MVARLLLSLSLGLGLLRGWVGVVACHAVEVGLEVLRCIGVVCRCGMICPTLCLLVGGG